jgi:hypothetical protein
MEAFLATRNRTYLKRSALLKPCKSAVQHLIDHGDDMAYRNIMGIDKDAFLYLVAKVARWPL